MNFRFVFFFLALLFIPRTVAAEVNEKVAEILNSKCVDCHSAEDPNGNFNLDELLQAKLGTEKTDELWARVERMVASRKMPPPAETPLLELERQSIVQWYREAHILRDGKEHIGPTPLRRLTRYELENTLEGLLHVDLKPTYVYSTQRRGFRQSTIEKLYPADTLGPSGFDNDAERMRDVKVPLLKYIKCVDYALRAFDQSASAREKVLGFSDMTKEITEKEAQRVLEKFATRASRGYFNKADRSLVLSRYQEVAQDQSSYVAFREAMRQALLSPSFLYRLEGTRDSKQPYKISAHELAVRLSYFLWSSMPDDELFKVAADDSLLEESVLRAQIQRMLASPKRVALSENFAGQWLGFANLKTDPVYYRGENWTRGVYDELLFSFDELIRSDRSILEMIDADWVYLRPEVQREAGGKPEGIVERYPDIFAARRSRKAVRVERFYRPPEIRAVKNDRLGGMITSTGIMRLTSGPSETKPIRRGVWLLENIIGEEMQPPENVPPISESAKKLDGQQANGVADILKLHTGKEACHACHQHIDPLGLGLENFSELGVWRTKYKDKKRIASSGKLPNGKTFSTPKELKQELVTYYRDRIVENTIRKMMSYALGRKLRPYDRPEVERIQKHLGTNGYRMVELIKQIILSKQFRNRQDQL